MTRTFESSPPFPDGARTSLADPQLRRNLAHATRTIRTKRDRVVGELKAWEDLRLAGEAIKTAALADLDTLLLQFEARLEAAGGQLHWASSAADASRIAVELARSAGAADGGGVVKIKSMTTGEIELNPALEAAGITAYETDLAELIVQLGDDLPSHIVVPAIHRSRDQIRTTFLDHMGEWGRPARAGLTSEPADLASSARLHLRERFLEADVAISGANFLVAETGSVVVVESEGNGRMCLTLPRTLITVAGIDKVIPRFEDLDVFLQLLPRSATGERMNPYTSVWTGVHPGDGPQEVHVVLLDNGRSRALADPVGRQALRCIRCAACLNVCPVYERVGGHAYGSVYPGPIGAVLTPQLDHVATYPVAASLPYASTLCGACFDACPVRIDIPRLLVHLRGEVVDARRSAVPLTQEQAVMRIASWGLGRPGRIRAFVRLGTVGSKVIGDRRVRLPGWLAGWSALRSTPLPAEPAFSTWWHRTHGAPAGAGTHAASAAGGAAGASASGAPGAAGASASGASRGRPQRVTVRRRLVLRRRTVGRPIGLLPAAPAGARPSTDAGFASRPDGRPVDHETRPVVGKPPAGACPSEPVPQQTHARATVLTSIGRALDSERTPLEIPRSYRRHASTDGSVEMIELFVARVEDYRAIVTRTTPAGIAGTIAGLLRGPDGEVEESVVVPPDLPPEWLALSGSSVQTDTPPLSTVALDDVGAVVTTCAVGIAETGTVVLDGGPGQGRRALTLVPDHHIVILREDQIVADVPASLSRVRPTGPQTWISGPSATSDIELQRVEGVHGPRRLDVVVVGTDGGS